MKQTVFLNLGLAYPFLHTVLARLDWKFIRVKENSVYHGVSLNFHKMKRYLWIISGNVDVISQLKQTVFPLYAAYPFLQTVSAIVEWKVVKIKEGSVFGGVSLNSHKMKSYMWLLLTTWMPFHYCMKTECFPQFESGLSISAKWFS